MILEVDGIKRTERIFETQEFCRSDCLYEQDWRHRRGRGSSPVDHHRVGQGHRAVVVAQDQGIAQKRFHHGGKDG